MEAGGVAVLTTAGKGRGKGKEKIQADVGRWFVEGFFTSTFTSA
jgi:hypothetical protein